MKKLKRTFLAFFIAAGLGSAAIYLFTTGGGISNPMLPSTNRPHEIVTPEIATGIKESSNKEMAEEMSKALDFKFEPIQTGSAPQKPIEEELLEVGEDPGAVFYMSRIRETMKEENPKFSRELFRQMGEFHSNSVLLEEAKLLLSIPKGGSHEGS